MSGWDGKDERMKLPQNARHCVIISSRHHSAVVVLRRPHLLLLRPDALVLLRPHLVLVVAGHLQWCQRAGIFNIRFVVPQLFRRRRRNLKKKRARRVVRMFMGDGRALIWAEGLKMKSTARAEKLFAFLIHSLI